MWKVVNESGAVFVLEGKRAENLSEEMASALAEWFSSPRYGALAAQAG